MRTLLRKCVVIAISCCIFVATQPIFANEINSYNDEIDTIILNEDEFGEIDHLIEQRVNALDQGDIETYDKISTELENLGCESISINEILELTGETFDAENMIQTYSAASTNVSFSKAVTSVTYNGKSYKVMKIIAEPSGKGTFYKTGNTTKTYNNAIKTGSLSLIKSTASAVAGTKVYTGLAVTLYDAIKDFVSAVSSTTTVEDVEANYTWSVSEVCCFLYVYDSSAKTYILGARYNKAKHVVAVSIPTMKVKNGKLYTDISQTKYSKWNSSPNYGSATIAIKNYKQGVVYSSYLSSIKITGCNGKTVKNLYLQCPESAVHLGYIF